MKKKPFIKRIALSIVLLIVLALATVYTWSTVILNKTYSAPLTEIHIPNDSKSIIEGKHLIQIEHCNDCYGKNLTGDNFLKFVAPNLTQIIPTYSDAELERLLKVGIKKSGTSVNGMSVVWMYHQLKDESIAQMITYLHFLPGQ